MAAEPTREWPTHDVVSFDWSTHAVVASSALDSLVDDPVRLCRLRLDVAPRAATAGPTLRAATAARPGTLPTVHGNAAAAGGLLPTPPAGGLVAAGPETAPAVAGTFVAELGPAELDALIEALQDANAQLKALGR